MLYAITRGQVSAEAARTSEIVYLATTTQALRAAGLSVVVSNRHAELAYAELSDADSVLDGDDFVDWPLMREQYWTDTPDYPDKKERRQAECLAHPVVRWPLIRGSSPKRKMQRGESEIGSLARGYALPLVSAPTGTSEAWRWQSLMDTGTSSPRTSMPW